MGASDEPDPELTLIELAAIAMRHRRAVLGATGGVPLLVIAIVLIIGARYTASTTIIQQQPDANSTIATVAQQFGLTLPSTDESQSPLFYTDFLNARPTLALVVRMKVHPNGDSAHAVSLRQYLYDHHGDSSYLEERAIDKLDSRVDAVASLKTGVITISVTDRDKYVATEVAQKLLAILTDYNNRVRQTQAHAEREFAQQRLAQLDSNVRVAEDRAQDFLVANRAGFQSSPKLSFEYDRIMRDVQLLRATLTSVAQAFEQARLDEVRDTPLMTVIAAPTIPGRPDSKHFLILLPMALLVGFLGGTAYAFVKERALTKRGS